MKKAKDILTNNIEAIKELRAVVEFNELAYQASAVEVKEL